MIASPVWRGDRGDHIVATCPTLARLPERRVLIDSVDPAGTDVCGWCRRVWLSRDRKATP